MLSLALAWAEVLDVQHIFFGANAVDYSGYPDCRPEYVRAFEAMANLATKAAVEGAQALLFVTPEHNRSMPALLKNAIDWGTRPWGKSSWPGKPAAIIGTSGGAVSTAVAQQHLRAVLAGLPDMPLMSGEAYIQFKPELFDEAHDVTDAAVKPFLKAFIDKFAAFAGKLAAA